MSQNKFNQNQPWGNPFLGGVKVAITKIDIIWNIFQTIHGRHKNKLSTPIFSLSLDKMEAFFKWQQPNLRKYVILYHVYHE